MSTPTEQNMSADQDMSNNGGYELLCQRLASQGQTLLAKAGVLNESRLAAFGRAELRLLGRTRARTENACQARDLVRVGDLLLFAYNVHLGLRKETRIDDVFSLYRLSGEGDTLDLQPVAVAGSFLDEARFVADFRELYAYYKNASLRQLRVTGEKLLVAFQIGLRPTDVRVFRWQMNRDGSVHYIDNRGERDIVLPPAHDFDWVATTRAEHINGKHPHVNILDTLFVETIGGDLTVKVENNTDTGRGIYSEPVDDANQSLTDAEVSYAQLGSLILLKILPYRETVYRYLVFNSRTQQVLRIDGIGESCVQLPEDHGIIFPGGCYLQSGEYKTFSENVAGMKFKRMIRSPNGEDVLYVFYEPIAGRLALLAYNLIDKTLSSPLLSNGYARFDDGQILLFTSESEEATRLHPMQLWNTPFCSEDHASATPPAGFFGRIGNAELVRGIAEVFAIARGTAELKATRVHYETLIRSVTHLMDGYFWLDAPEAGDMAQELKAIVATARLTLDEFDKVQSIRHSASKALEDASAKQKQCLTSIAATIWRTPQQFVETLAHLRLLRGELLALREQRYIDTTALDQLDAGLAQQQQRLSDETVRFLADPKSLALYHQELDKIAASLPEISTVIALVPQLKALDETASGLDLLTELLAGLESGDPTVRTRILDDVGEVYARLNQVRASVRQQRDQLAVREASAEFGAQFKLFGQSVANTLDLLTTPEQCEDSLTQLLTQLEGLESRFGEQATFLDDILAKREAVFEAFSAKKQTLLAARQQRAQSLNSAAARIISGIEKRLQRFESPEAVHSYFAADAMVVKLRGLIDELRQLNATVEADTVEAKLKSLRDNAVGMQRDRSDLFGSDGIRLGRHTFSVTTQAVDLTLLMREDALCIHLTGTDFYDPVHDERLTPLRQYWSLTLPSESGDVYRAEYLAWRMLMAMHAGELSAASLEEARLSEAGLLPLVREFASVRYQDAYQKGVHDVDAAQILAALLPMDLQAGLLRHAPLPRALAALFWQFGIWEVERPQWLSRAENARKIAQEFGQTRALQDLHAALRAKLLEFLDKEDIDVEANIQQALLDYLLAELTSGHNTWCTSADASHLHEQLLLQLERRNALSTLREGLQHGQLRDRWALAQAWCEAFALHTPADEAQAQTLSLACVPEAAAMLLCEMPRQRLNVALAQHVSGLLGTHTRIQAGRMTLDLNEFSLRLQHHDLIVEPAFRQLQAIRQQLIDEMRKSIRLEQYQAKPLAGFVRNQLIDQVYLPLIGDNLAKQIGTAGDARRSDLMGLLLLISPPGYGKTTLMEYVANRLGLIFVRVNCPALGHDVTTLDPAQAGNSAARQELEKLNLGLAMGNNVMLYLDDIQHTNPEFLQRFIALCDGTRRIEGIWRGQPRSYDLRGKRFCVVMAGNPYTESGDTFRIPDMLANRADIYNLGDVLSGKEHLFALSYIENSLTANPVLAPLANRDPADLQLFLRWAAGEQIQLTDFKHGYGSAEAGEIVAVLQKLFAARDVLMKVNAAYIASAAQADAYRVEPPFKLQGSYRNMSKLAVKISALLNETELANLIRDHYLGEAQTLTHGAEENLLKLKAMQDALTPEELARWEQIKRDFLHHKRMGGSDADGATKLAQQVSHIVTALSEISTRLGSDERISSGLSEISQQLAKRQNSEALLQSQELNHLKVQTELQAKLQQQEIQTDLQLKLKQWQHDQNKALGQGLGQINDTLSKMQPQIVIEPQPEIVSVLQGLAHAYENSLIPVISAMQHKIRLDHDIWDKVQVIGEQIRLLEMHLKKTS
ncbi:DNA repair ATPase [Chitinibacter sp. GC72]|uniref:DNA repair ATPase n=1 Tax=Chitinibacter sp. GC72 TaxID=1526917 RepID=UPI001E468972|nr:DNA repair ATPase [Chitinibacter sp. GC72]